MTPDHLMATTQRLMMQVEALAALGACLRGDPQLDPKLANLLHEVVDHLGLDSAALGHVPTEARAVSVGLIRSFLRQALDLVEHPGRPHGWTYEDPVVLQSQGAGSMSLASIVRRIAPSLDGLAERLEEDGAHLLDIGCGVGLLAIAMAREYPRLTSVGIDVWEPALALGHANVRQHGLDGRVLLRHQDVRDLEDEARYALIWVPGPFLPLEVVDETLRRSVRALEPGGWLLFGRYAGPEDPLARTLAAIRVVRSGGHPWSEEEIRERLEEVGLVGVRVVDRAWEAPIGLVVGQRPT